MSSKPAHNMSSNVDQTQSEGNHHLISDMTQPSSELNLDELTHGVIGMIIVMICRSWDVHTITGRYGNAIYSSAKANVAHNFLKLKEGLVYPINNFVVQANKEEYRIFRDHAYMIELDGTASVRKTFVKGGGFIQYPFQLAKLEIIALMFSLKPSVMAYYSHSASCVLEKLYLSRGSFSHILDDPQILALKALRAENSENEVSLSQTVVHDDYSQAKEGTLENLLLIGLGTEKMIVKIDDIRTRKGRNFPSCGGEKCKKGVVRKDGSFWCQACDKAVEYPVLRFRLELDVSDKTASTVVVMFDEPATELLKCSTDSLAAADEDVGLTYADDVGLPRPLANIIGTTQTLEIKSHTYYEHGMFESFTCWRIASKEVVEEDVGLSNVNTTPDINIKQTKRLTTKPTIATPSKPTTQNEEDTCGMDDGQADGKDSSVSDKRKKKQRTLWTILPLRKPPLPNNTNAGEKQKAMASTSRHPFNTSRLSSSERPQTRASTRLPKRAALTSTVNFELRLLSERISAQQYNAPTVSEVAALITNDFGDGLPLRDIVMNNKDGGSKRISKLHPSYMDLQYPLLFPYGEDDLPHAHILLWLEEECKCKTLNQIDDIISAELPSSTTDLEGYKVVTEFMLQGQCGKGIAYTIVGKCLKKFPKPFYSETNLEEDRYLVYHRRDSKVQTVKDHATFVIQENVQKLTHGEPEKVAAVDEIKNYINCQYLAPCEAVWQPFSFDIHYSYPSVMKLNFHLEDQQPITFRDSQNLPALLNREEIKITMFTKWFDLIKRDTEARKLTYADIPKNYEQTWELLSEDILPRKHKLFNYPNLQLTDEQIKNYCLVEIETLLNRNGGSLADFQELPRPNPALLTNMDNRLIREALDFDTKQSKLEHDQLHSLLNPEQHVIYDHANQSVYNQSGQFYFVYGPGGTRKTFLYKTIILKD
ncbi:RNA-directed DNA polymerase, eukaryota [Tanacetum coccineum]